MMLTDSIWGLQEIIIYDASREKVFHCQHFYLKQILYHESIKFVLFYSSADFPVLNISKWCHFNIMARWRNMICDGRSVTIFCQRLKMLRSVFLAFHGTNSAKINLYSDVVLFFFSLFSKTSFPPPHPYPLAMAVNKSPMVFIFYHARSTNFEEKIEGL